MATQLLIDDLLSFVTAALKPEGAEGNPDHARALLRQCFAELYRETQAYYTSWDNDTDSDLTLTGNTCPLPTDCFEVRRVEWDGSDNPLDIVSAEKLDYEQPGWRDETGDPSACVVEGSQIVLDTSPTGTTTGLLVVRGYGCPDEGDVLAMLPDDVQLSGAKYILANWPVDPENKASMFRWNRYVLEWEKAEPKLKAAIEARKFQPFQYL